MTTTDRYITQRIHSTTPAPPGAYLEVVTLWHDQHGAHLHDGALPVLGYALVADVEKSFRTEGTLAEDDLPYMTELVPGEYGEPTLIDDLAGNTRRVRLVVPGVPPPPDEQIAADRAQVIHDLRRGHAQRVVPSLIRLALTHWPTTQD